MGNGRGVWNQYYRESICDKAETIEELENSIKPKKVKSIFDYFKSFFYKKQKDEETIKERIENLRKSIKSDEQEMFD